MQTHKFDIIIPPQDIAWVPGMREKLANGDRDAFAWVYKNYCKRVYNYALLVTGEVTIAEDLVQDVFIKLWMKREKLIAVENFNGYLYVLYRNHVMNVLREDKKESAGRKRYLSNITFSRNDVEEMINYKETTSLVKVSIKELPKCCRQIFEMTQSGMNNEEIVGQLGIRPKTVWNQLQNARKFIKEKVNNN